jgi:hypothetical protein
MVVGKQLAVSRLLMAADIKTWVIYVQLKYKSGSITFFWLIDRSYLSDAIKCLH